MAMQRAAVVASTPSSSSVRRGNAKQTQQPVRRHHHRHLRASASTNNTATNSNNSNSSNSVSVVPTPTLLPGGGGGGGRAASSAVAPLRAIMSPSLESSLSSAGALLSPLPTKVKVVAVVPATARSFLPYPPGLPIDMGAGPDWMEVMQHMALRLTWADPGFALDVIPDDAPIERIRAAAMDADVFVVMGVQDPVVGKQIADALAGVPTGAALGCCSALDGQSRIVYQPITELRAMEAKLVPWGQASKDLRLMDQVTALYKRENHLDLLFLHLLLIDASGTRVPAVDINQDLNIGNVFCIAKNCNKQLMACYGNALCPQLLDCIDACGLNDQVCTYTCIRSFQNPEFQGLARCMLHKHNCLGNDAQRPELPEVLPMTSFRGEPLTHDTAEAIMQGWYGELPFSWLAVAGQNPAYDHFPCQYQIWYRGKAKGAFWYNPVFKVNTLTGEEVWRRSDYRCKRGDTPGTFFFSFMDNGVTSLEYWRIVDCDDDLAWSLYYYAGAAKVAGQAYIGAVLATKDGKWPGPEHMPRIEKSLWEGCGVKLWEMCEVDNCNCGDAPLDLLHDAVMMNPLVPFKGVVAGPGALKGAGPR